MKHVRLHTKDLFILEIVKKQKKHNHFKHSLSVICFEIKQQPLEVGLVIILLVLPEDIKRWVAFAR